MIDKINIPLKARASVFIPKKTIFELNILDTKNKQIINENIESIYLKGEINSNTIDINSYTSDNEVYESILIVEVAMKKFRELGKVNEIIQRIFPNPLIIIYKQNCRYSIASALKRINKNNVERSVIEDTNLSSIFNLDERAYFLSKIDFSKNDFNNLKEYYYYFNNIIKIEKNLPIIGSEVLEKLSPELFLEIDLLEQLISDLDDLNNTYKGLRMEAAKMKQFSLIREKESELNNKIKKIKEM